MMSCPKSEEWGLEWDISSFAWDMIRSSTLLKKKEKEKCYDSNNREPENIETHSDLRVVAWQWSALNNVSGPRSFIRLRSGVSPGCLNICWQAVRPDADPAMIIGRFRPETFFTIWQTTALSDWFRVNWSTFQKKFGVIKVRALLGGRMHTHTHTQ